jgi:hypothetical protein
VSIIQTTPPNGAAANPAGALWLQSTPPVGRVAELRSLGDSAHRMKQFRGITIAMVFATLHFLFTGLIYCAVWFDPDRNGMAPCLLIIGDLPVSIATSFLAGLAPSHISYSTFNLVVSPIFFFTIGTTQWWHWGHLLDRLSSRLRTR